MIAGALAPQLTAQFARDVLEGLSGSGQKTLPSTYLYDAVGSALFDTITVLPEYGLTRADARLLREHSVEILRRAGRPRAIVELGSGSGAKTRWVLQAATARGPTDYYPIDISATALDQCCSILGAEASVRTHPVCADYLPGLSEVVARRSPGESLILLFLGSTIGNFDRESARAFLLQVRSLLTAGDTLLLGTDLVKSVAQMLVAYDDPIGVTAAFNLNLLARINRELRGGFEIRRFRHLSRFDEVHCRIEMHLQSTVRQTAPIRELGVQIEFAAGETIWTEASHKFRVKDVIDLAGQTGFEIAGQWIDREWPFAETLLTARN